MIRTMAEKNNKIIKEIIIAYVFFSLLVFGILMGLGTITSGFHLVDDHEIMSFYISKMNGISIGEVIKGYFWNDFHYRFRPLFYPIRIFLSYTFNGNFYLLSIIRGLEVTFALEIFYIVLRKINCGIGYSLAGSLMALMGSMVGIWWKLGPQELSATWMIGLATLCYLESNKSKKYNKIFGLGSLFWMVLASLYKESFIMLIPAYVFLHLIDFDTEINSFEDAIEMMKGKAKANWIVILISGLVLFTELYIILFAIGSQNIEYGAINYDKGIWFYLKVFINNMRLPLRIGQYVLFSLFIVWIYRRNFWKQVRQWWREIILFFLIITPQFVIYAQNGIEERYVLPWSLGIVYFFVGVISRDKNLIDNRRKLYNFALIAITVFNFALAIKEASVFTYRGQSIQKMLQITLENTDEDSNILASFNKYDESDWTIHVWGELNHRQNVFRHTENDDVYLSYSGEQAQLKDIDIVLFYDKSDRHYMYEPPIDFSEFEIMDCGAMRVAKRIVNKN